MGEKRGTRRNDLLEAATRVFSEKGFHCATMDEIVKTAGTGKGTLYHYFESKEELFYAVIDRIQESLLEEMREIAGQNMEPQRKIEELMEVYVRYLRAYSNLWRVLYSELPRKHGRPPAWGKKRVRSKFRPVVELVEIVLEEGRSQGRFEYPDSHTTAKILCTAANIYSMHGNEDSLPVDGRIIARLILYGIYREGKEKQDWCKGAEEDGCV